MKKLIIILAAITSIISSCTQQEAPKKIINRGPAYYITVDRGAPFLSTIDSLNKVGCKVWGFHVNKYGDNITIKFQKELSFKSNF